MSLFFKSHVESLSQPWGNFKIGIDRKESLLVNSLYENDANYPKEYYTNLSLSNSLHNKDIKNNVLDIAKKFKVKLIIEIGCGQGDIVQFLNKKKFKTIGYDPIIRSKNRFLKSGFYPSAKNNLPADLYILQCVLPHIVNPKAYLMELFKINRKALVYIEFPSLTFILKNNLFYQFGYEHVNYFNFGYFKKHFNLIDKGTYLGGEWNYVLIEYGESNRIKNMAIYVYIIWIKLVLAKRKRLLSKLSKITTKKSVFIFSAGGKGAMLAAHIQRFSKSNHRNIFMIDNDSRKHNLFLGSTGIKVISPQKALTLAKKDSILLVANPNHKTVASDLFASKMIIRTLKII